VRIVDENDDGRALRDVGQQDGKAAQETRLGRRVLRCRTASGRDAARNGCQIVEEPAAQPGDLLVPKRSQVVLERLGPDAERCCGAERIAACGQRDDLADFPPEELARQSRLSDPRFGDQQHRAELSGRSAPVLAVEDSQFGIPAYELRGRQQG
jgi:hypothetical protein